jgi:hypothetical protein
MRCPLDRLKLLLDNTSTGLGFEICLSANGNGTMTTSQRSNASEAIVRLAVLRAVPIVKQVIQGKKIGICPTIARVHLDLNNLATLGLEQIIPKRGEVRVGPDAIGGAPISTVAHFPKYHRLALDPQADRSVGWQ